MTGLTWHQARAAGLHALPYDIVAYSYFADLYCPACIIPILNEAGLTAWRSLPDELTVEEVLDQLAARLRVCRANEATFDSDDFPKIVFRDSIEDELLETCGRCQCDLRDQSPTANGG